MLKIGTLNVAYVEESDDFHVSKSFLLAARHLSSKRITVQVGNEREREKFTKMHTVFGTDDLQLICTAERHSLFGTDEIGMIGQFICR